MHTLAEYKQMKRLAHAKATAASALVETTETTHPEYSSRKSALLLHYWRYRVLCTAVDILEWRELQKQQAIQVLRKAGANAFTCGDKTYITA